MRHQRERWLPAHIWTSVQAQAETPHHSLPTRKPACAHGPGASVPDGGREAQETHGSRWLTLEILFLGRETLADGQGVSPERQPARTPSETNSTLPHATPGAQKSHHLGHSVPVNDPTRCSLLGAFVQTPGQRHVVTFSGHLSSRVHGQKGLLTILLRCQGTDAIRPPG